jgi:hypothetical protein
VAPLQLVQPDHLQQSLRVPGGGEESPLVPPVCQAGITPLYAASCTQKLDKYGAAKWGRRYFLLLWNLACVDFHIVSILIFSSFLIMRLRTVT